MRAEGGRREKLRVRREGAGKVRGSVFLVTVTRREPQERLRYGIEALGRREE